MAYVLTHEEAAALGFDVKSAVAEFEAAIEAHRFTENVPAPVAHPLVEMIVRNYGGKLEVLPLPPLAPPEPEPAPPPVPQSVSRRQAIKAMRIAGIITPEQSVAWTQSNILPPFITRYLDMLPPDDLADAYEDLAAATEYRIDAPMVSLLGYAANQSRAQIDDLFRLASTL